MKQRRRILWWLVGFAGLLVLALTYQHLAPRWALSAYKARLRAQGIPLTLEECLPTPVPEQVAAAQQFGLAAQRLPSLAPPGQASWALPMQMVGPARAKAGWRQPNAAYDTEDSMKLREAAQRYGLSGSGDSADALVSGLTSWSDLAVELEAVAPLLVRLEEASLVEAFNWNLDYSQGFNVMLPYLANCKEAIRWLNVATQLALREGRLDDATRLIQTQLRLARNMQSEGLLIDELVRIAMTSIAWNSTWDVLQADGWSDAQLDRLLQGWQELDGVEAMIRALKQERALGLYEYDRCRRSPSRMVNMWGGPGVMPGSTATADTFVEQAIEWLSDLVGNAGGLLISRWWGWFDSYEDERFYIETIQTAIGEAERRLAYVRDHRVSATGLAPGETWLLENMLLDDRELQRHWFAGMALISVDKAMNNAFRVQMQKEMMLAVIALKRHQLRHNHLPGSLDDLVPEFLSAVPVDWMDGRPMRYRRLDTDRFSLYSVNEDQIDDGGDATNALPRSRSFSPYFARDFVWPEEILPPLVAAGDFEAGFRLSSANRDPEPVRLVVRTNELPLWITVIPKSQSEPEDPEGHSPIGLLEVATGSPPTPIQTLTVRGADAGRLKSMFEVMDINFDGYPDLLTVYEAGAKAGRRSLWLYESSHGVYVTNAATARFQKLSHNTLELDHDQQLIRMTRFIGICTNSWETWRIQDDQLLGVEAVTHRPEDNEYCQVTHLRRIQGEMKAVEKTRMPCPKPNIGRTSSASPHAAQR